MKSGAGLLVVVAASFLSVFALGDELAAYGHCVDELKLTREHYQSKLPPGTFAWDRKLLHMTQGIDFIEKNYLSLRQQLGTPAGTSADRHLMQNAVEACQSYLASFELRAQRFVVFVACLGLLVGALTLWLFFTMVPVSSRKDVKHVPADKKPKKGMGPGHPPADVRARISSKRR